MQSAEHDPQFLTAALRQITSDLERQRGALYAEISCYPAPIPACDVQFNHLLEQRAAISQELSWLRAWQIEPESHVDLGKLREFLQSSRSLDAAMMQGILAKLHAVAIPLERPSNE